MALAFNLDRCCHLALCLQLWPVLKMFYDRNDSGQYYKNTFLILIDDPS